MASAQQRHRASSSLSYPFPAAHARSTRVIRVLEPNDACPQQTLRPHRCIWSLTYCTDSPCNSNRLANVCRISRHRNRGASANSISLQNTLLWKLSSQSGPPVALGKTNWTISGRPRLPGVSIDLSCPRNFRSNHRNGKRSGRLGLILCGGPYTRIQHFTTISHKKPRPAFDYGAAGR